jgi:hypothetical protein
MICDGQRIAVASIAGLELCTPRPLLRMGWAQESSLDKAFPNITQVPRSKEWKSTEIKGLEVTMMAQAVVEIAWRELEETTARLKG